MKDHTSPETNITEEENKSVEHISTFELFSKIQD